MSTLVAQTISNGTVSTSSANVIQGSAKAWVNYKGTTTRGINGSYNVSSVTFNATGDYIINFTNAMPNSNYAAVGMTQHDTEMGVMIYGTYNGSPSIMTTTALRIATAQSNTRYDCTTICVAIFSS